MSGESIESIVAKMRERFGGYKDDIRASAQAVQMAEDAMEFADRFEKAGNRLFYDRYHEGRWDGYFEAVGVMDKAAKEYRDRVKACERMYGRHDGDEGGAE